jgi:hypothetical protein
MGAKKDNGIQFNYADRQNQMLNHFGRIWFN